MREVMGAILPIGRMGEVEDMARLAEFLVSDRNTFMTGSDVVCDGGRSIAQ